MHPASEKTPEIAIFARFSLGNRVDITVKNSLDSETVIKENLW
jgi:hypothetical protein